MRDLQRQHKERQHERQRVLTILRESSSFGGAGRIKLVALQDQQQYHGENEPDPRRNQATMACALAVPFGRRRRGRLSSLHNENETTCFANTNSLSCAIVDLGNHRPGFEFYNYSQCADGR